MRNTPVDDAFNLDPMIGLHSVTSFLMPPKQYKHIRQHFRFVHPDKSMIKDKNLFMKLFEIVINYRYQVYYVVLMKVEPEIKRMLIH